MNANKPCPFCGADAWDEPQALVGIASRGKWEMACENNDCGASYVSDSAEAAIAGWNRRARTDGAS